MERQNVKLSASSILQINKSEISKKMNVLRTKEH